MQTLCTKDAKFTLVHVVCIVAYVVYYRNSFVWAQIEDCERPCEYEQLCDYEEINSPSLFLLKCIRCVPRSASNEERTRFNCMRTQWKYQTYE